MRSAWTGDEADAAIARYDGFGRDLALRIYTTRLLGRIHVWFCMVEEIRRSRRAPRISTAMPSTSFV